MATGVCSHAAGCRKRARWIMVDGPPSTQSKPRTAAGNRHGKCEDEGTWVHHLHGPPASPRERCLRMIKLAPHHQKPEPTPTVIYLMLPQPGKTRQLLATLFLKTTIHQPQLRHFPSPTFLPRLAIQEDSINLDLSRPLPQDPFSFWNFLPLVST
jgi:hypothetical protein